MTKYWFKPKKYGYGFYPTSWEGWLSTFSLVLLVFASAYTNNFFEQNLQEAALTVKDAVRFIIDVFLITSIFTYLSEKKTDGKLGWRWGNK
jgi:hypothetical protein